STSPTRLETVFHPALLPGRDSAYTPLPQRLCCPPPEGKEPRMDSVGSAPEQLATRSLSPQTQPRGRRRTRKRLQLPVLSVVIVNYRQWEDTAGLVKQLAASACVRRGTAEIIVVDNHSQPHPLMARLRRAPGVSLRRWGRNQGFARAVNEGCRLSRGRWFLLLNPDMTVAETFLDEVLAQAERLSTDDPKTGIIG